MAGTTTLELPRRAGSASIARLIVTAHGSSLDSERLKSANLIVSELVSNAFRHGEGRIELSVESGPDGVCASVHDEGAGTIATPDPRPARGGWGLYFVDRLADTLGRRRRRLARLVPRRRRHGSRLTVSRSSTRVRSRADAPRTPPGRRAADAAPVAEARRGGKVGAPADGFRRHPRRRSRQRRGQEVGEEHRDPGDEQGVKYP